MPYTDAERERIESALQREGYILLAWAIFGTKLRGWYILREGGRWVYQRYYDKETLKEMAGLAVRRAAFGVYKWFTTPSLRDARIELHLCAPPYLLLDNKETRREYLAGNLSANFA
jgi:hypothetical protein